MGKLYKNKKWLQAKFKELKYAQRIGKEIGVSGDTIEYWRRKFNILKENDNQANRKYTLNENYFSVIDNEDKAYWLGFIMADGCVTKSQPNKPYNRFEINLKIEDFSHLEKLNKLMEYNKPLITKSVSSRGHISEICQLRVNSAKLCADLMKHDICPNKTGKECIPESVPKELLRHFLRGFFDGDGTLYSDEKNLYCSICGSSKHMIDQVKELVKEELDIDLYINERKEYSVPFYITGTKSQQNVKLFLDYIYKDANIYLDRKYNKYLSHYAPLSGDA